MNRNKKQGLCLAGLISMVICIALFVLVVNSLVKSYRGNFKVCSNEKYNDWISADVIYPRECVLNETGKYIKFLEVNESCLYSDKYHNDYFDWKNNCEWGGPSYIGLVIKVGICAVLISLIAISMSIVNNKSKKGRQY